MVDACQACKNCNKFEEQYCATGSVFTYGGQTKYGRAGPDGLPTVGGYSDKMAGGAFVDTWHNHAPSLVRYIVHDQ